nr:hypothetical protein [Mesorhizobium sp.]
MNKSSSQAPTPDPNIGKAALLQAETGVAWMDFAKDAFKVSTERQAELDKLTKQVTESQLGIMNDQAAWSKADRQRYETTFRPIEDQFVQEASNYGSQERQDAAAATAMADVQSASAIARASARRDAASMGVNPNSGRFAGINRAGEMGTALATAGAANNARTSVRDKGLALKADVVNMGRGLPTQSAQAASLGLGAGSSAVGLNQGTNQQYLASTGIMGQGFQGQMAGYQGQANTLSGPCRRRRSTGGSFALLRPLQRQKLMRDFLREVGEIHFRTELKQHVVGREIGALSEAVRDPVGMLVDKTDQFPEISPVLVLDDLHHQFVQVNVGRFLHREIGRPRLGKRVSVDIDTMIAERPSYRGAKLPSHLELDRNRDESTLASKARMMRSQISPRNCSARWRARCSSQSRCCQNSRLRAVSAFAATAAASALATASRAARRLLRPKRAVMLLPRGG